MRDLFARWASPSRAGSSVTGVQGVTRSADSDHAAATSRSAPVTRAPSQGVQGVTEAAERALALHPCTQRGPDGVAAPGRAEPLETPHVGGLVTPRTPATPFDSDLLADFEERAAIMEFEGELSRGEAESAAALAIELHRK